MRTYALIITVAALFVVPVAGFAQTFEIGPGGFRVYEDRPTYGRGNDGPRGGGYCEQLRSACVNKERLGEVGEGNCRRYRETCLRPVRRDVCLELREACLNKERLGEVGEGNCRRYRQTCRGQY